MKSLLGYILLLVTVGTVEGQGNRAKVAFQVAQEQNPKSLSNNEVLRFDQVKLNTGNAYNHNSGIFIVPVTGTYLFWCNIMSYSKQVYAIRLQKKGQVIARGYPGNLVDGGVATITHAEELTKGDHVWFEHEEHAGSRTKIWGAKYSSYGGTLLFI